jgi:hypothetical protein
MNKRFQTLCCFLAFLLLVMNGCNLKDEVDKVIDQIQQTQAAITAQSDAWRAALPKLIDQLSQLESQASADAKTVIGDTRNQVQDLMNDTIKFANINAQEIVAKTGAEFRCDATFTMNGISARLQYLIDDLKFWKRNKHHSDNKPVHTICQILGENLPLYPQAGGAFGIDSSKLVSLNIVELFGYNFSQNALPHLDLVAANGTVIRGVNVTPAYVTQYQLALDFSTETFAGAGPASRIILRWPDQPEPNTINLILEVPSKLKIVSPVFTPTSPIATKDQVSLSVTVTNTGGVPSGAFTVTWTPQGEEGNAAVKSVNQLPLKAGESRSITFPATYVYQTEGTKTNVVALSNGDDTETFPISVQSNIANVQDFPINKPVVNRAWTPINIHVSQGDRVEIIAGGGCVNTHGHGDTTKRYVDPLDEGNSCKLNTRMYFGTIAIPGTIEEATRKSLHDFWLIDKFTIVKSDSVVELGYVDDDLGDNDYSDFDNGTCDQCRNYPPAYVTIRVTKYK